MNASQAIVALFAQHQELSSAEIYALLPKYETKTARAAISNLVSRRVLLTRKATPKNSAYSLNPDMPKLYTMPARQEHDSGEKIKLAGGGHIMEQGNRRIVRLMDGRHNANDAIGGHCHHGKGLSTLAGDAAMAAAG